MKCVRVLARASKLSIKQAEEIYNAIAYHYPEIKFDLKVFYTTGDKDQKTSLRSLGKTDFFTKELDEKLVNLEGDIAVHSAKDLPETLPKDLEIFAITEPLNTEDVIVFQNKANLSDKSKKWVIATSSESREQNVLKMYPNAEIVDLRGTILERLKLVEEKKVDGVVLAKVALIRLGLDKLNMVILKGKTTPMQGSLAVVGRKKDSELKKLFSKIDSRIGQKSLYFGLHSNHYYTQGEVVHLPLIRTCPITLENPQTFLNALQKSTFMIITSSQTLFYLFKLLDKVPFQKHLFRDKKFIVVGKSTAKSLQKKGLHPTYIAQNESAEGVIEILQRLKLGEKDSIFYPKSKIARPIILDYLKERGLSFDAFDLYETKTVLLDQKLNLSQYDEIVLTSSSCVKSFFENFGQIPDHLKVITKGKNTWQSLQGFGYKPVES